DTVRGGGRRVRGGASCGVRGAGRVVRRAARGGGGGRGRGVAVTALVHLHPRQYLTSQSRRGSQVVRQRSAKPLFAGSIPARASLRSRQPCRLFGYAASRAAGARGLR